VTRSARETWIGAHPWLEPIARFQGIVEGAAARTAHGGVALPAPAAWADDRAAGVPLLRCGSAAPALSAPAADVLGGLLEVVARAVLPDPLSCACRDVAHELRGPDERRSAVEWATTGAPMASPPPHPGLVRFLGWTAARRVLEPVIRGSAAWHGEERWGHGHCPTCGALPPCAQLAPGESARVRFLSCGCCGTRWRYRRIGCPFCGTEAQERLAILEVEGEAELRIDVCNECGGYLKTYTGEGDEELFLADWPTLHLDVLALQRGFQRAGASLYELPKDERRIEP
jgi:FdhE protein